MTAHHEDSKKEKQRKKNRKNWELFLISAKLTANVDIGAPEIETKPTVNTKKTVINATSRVAEIRNRLDNSRRISEDRWNRFAGTNDGGGRGR